MHDESGYIKLHRSMLSWEWFKDINTRIVFEYCLLSANWVPGRFQGRDVPVGSFITSYTHIAEDNGLTVKEVRTALKHLEWTHEIARYSTNRYTHIYVQNWELYQTEVASKKANKGQTDGKQKANKGQTDGKQKANKGQQYKNNKNIRNKENIQPSADTAEFDYDSIPIGRIIREDEGSDCD